MNPFGCYEVFNLLFVLKFVMVHGKEHQLSVKEVIVGVMISEKSKAAVIQV